MHFFPVTVPAAAGTTSGKGALISSPAGQHFEPLGLREQPAYHSLETLGDSTKSKRQTFESIAHCPDQKCSWELNRKLDEEGSAGLVTSA